MPVPRLLQTQLLLLLQPRPQSHLPMLLQKRDGSLTWMRHMQSLTSQANLLWPTSPVAIGVDGARNWMLMFFQNRNSRNGLKRMSFSSNWIFQEDSKYLRKIVGRMLL